MEHHTVGIRELKQNPSDIIARAASGTRFEVLSNGKPVGVVIQRDAGIRSRHVSAEAMVAMTRRIAADESGWAEQHRALQLADDDPIVDPWNDRAARAKDSHAVTPTVPTNTVPAQR